MTDVTEESPKARTFEFCRWAIFAREIIIGGPYLRWVTLTYSSDDIDQEILRQQKWFPYWEFKKRKIE